MSDMLSIGASGIRAYQTALGTVSDNIANAGSAGYSRRTASLVEVAPAGAIGLSSRVALPGNGVVVGGIARQADAYKATAVRTASTDLAKTEAGTTWLSRVESVMTQGAVGTRMTSFFAAAQTLAADPTSTSARAAMLASGATAASAFRTTGRALDASAAELDETMNAATRRLTSLGQALGTINDGLSRAAPGSTTAAALADRRDVLLEEMSAISDVSVQLDVAGRAAVRLGGNQGPLLVNGKESATVAVNRNSAGAMSFIVQRGADQADFVPTGGALAGMVDGAQRIADTRSGLNDLAVSFATTVNDQMKLGDDQAGNDGVAMFTVGTPATELTLAYDDPALIAAAARDGGPRDASNLTALQTARVAGKVESGATALVAGVAAAIEGRSAVSAAQGSIRDAAVAARDAVSGVDLDQEAIDLIRFQQAYQASSRVIQVARETIQTLLAIN